MELGNDRQGFLPFIYFVNYDKKTHKVGTTLTVGIVGGEDKQKEAFLSERDLYPVNY